MFPFITFECSLCLLFRIILFQLCFLAKSCFEVEGRGVFLKDMQCQPQSHEKPTDSATGDGCTCIHHCDFFITSCVCNPCFSRSLIRCWIPDSISRICINLIYKYPVFHLFNKQFLIAYQVGMLVGLVANCVGEITKSCSC